MCVEVFRSWPFSAPWNQFFFASVCTKLAELTLGLLGLRLKIRATASSHLCENFAQYFVKETPRRVEFHLAISVRLPQWRGCAATMVPWDMYGLMMERACCCLKLQS
ncbi:unnamed protein product [Polarella glacialis]|uniref:Uncharacterized protein n=1 Tax=Polarella glacialis TaxID=89957 RepID=A0A813IC70_POLGL|nr:unnamed protein product [Polarella glacialis]